MDESKRNVMKNKVINLIDELSEYGKTENDGVTRTLFSDIWMETQSFLESDLTKKGFTTMFDEVGNLYGTVRGTQDTDETIMIGSHIDTVVNGGKLDGQLGIVAGIVAIEELIEEFGLPKKNLEVVSMAEEEGSRFPFTFWGSKNIVGRVAEEEVKGLVDQDGVSFIEAMTDKGFGFRNNNSLARSDIKAYIELHIEQGGVLEKEEKSIGLVNGIVGQKRFLIEIDGEANHAGTTPMGYRKDSLHGASKMIDSIIELGKEFGDPLVVTIGRLDVTPNTSNVVPGKVIFSVDTRHTNNEIVNEFISKFSELIESISRDMDLNTKVNQYMDGYPVPMDEQLITHMEKICISKGMDYKIMHSGAGHDAQIFAPKVPTALIFVPSRKGISHSYLEFTNPDDYMSGVELLKELLYEIAY
ncbi:allantoate deiminase [Gudongella sp. DL1XJH-153]|uniref:allantoate deiminase n=1 Tax=Gudongella sp. DL1XJH-153 TaxID=3409804 RepID=UPI003BB55621